MTYPQPGPYSAYPQYPGAGVAAPRPPVPDTVRRAFVLMLAGAGLEVVSAVVSLTQLSRVGTILAQRDSALSPDAVDSLRNVVVAGEVFGAAVGVGLWVWMAFANRAGHNWARILGTVFYGLETLSTLIGVIGAGTLGAASTPAVTILSVVGWLLGLVIVILLWNKRSGLYFQPPVALGYGYPSPYSYPTSGQQYAGPGPQQPFGAPPQEGTPQQDPWSNPPQR